MPNSTFISVLLPAPFSPTRAWTVPGRTASVTPLRTRLPSYSLVMPRSSRTGAVMRAAARWRRLGQALEHVLVGHVIEHDQPLIALGVVLAHPDRATGLLLEVALHRGRVVVVGLVVDRVDQQIGEGADAHHVDRLRPGAEVPAHAALGDQPFVLGVDERHVAGLVGRDLDAQRSRIA